SGQGLARDPGRAHEYYHRACEGGSGLGCEGEARSYRDGIGAPPDAGAAERLFAQARIVYRVHCDQRHAVSCVRLAALHARGVGGPADDRVALTYRQKACALGHRASC
ncbi:MAG TPA: tetratricopeptide repeat protein, partial [Kofleriaceae bacterium]|nr:tetratricopeptide repeat protein [Kofleriaceae bacterium]